MSDNSQGREVVRQRRCDSPAPRATNAISGGVAASTPGMPQTDPVHALKSNKPQKSAPPLSAVVVLAVALLLGRAALITDTKELLGETPTRTALAVFLAVGAVVMRTDFIEFAKQEAKKESTHFESASTAWLWLLLVLLLSVAVAWNGTTAPLSPLFTAVTGPVATRQFSATTSLRWRISMKVADEVTILYLSIALAIGLATMISDLVEMTQQAQKENSAVAPVDQPEAVKIHKPSSSPSQWRLMACIALLIAVVAAFVASILEDM